MLTFKGKSGNAFVSVATKCSNNADSNLLEFVKDNHSLIRNTIQW